MLSSSGFLLLLLGLVGFASLTTARRSSPCDHPGLTYGNEWPAPCINGYHQFGDGWLLVQQHVDDSTSFYRSWTDYRDGFGQGDNIWIGLQVLHEQLSSGIYELVIEMADEYGEYRFARYSHFLIGNETENYVLKELGQVSGTAEDVLRTHKGAAFSTFDRDNDGNKMKNCAVGLSGGWWFTRDCLDRSVLTCNLNSKLDGSGRRTYWRVRRGNESLKYVRMMIREL